VVVVALVVAALHHSLDVITTVPSFRIGSNVLGAVSKEMTKLRDAGQMQ
jgi:hypothetical protein